MSRPTVTVMTATYNRPPSHLHLLGECVQSVLDQDYEGEIEHLIVNDCPAHRLACATPGARVINLPLRCPTLGIKRQMMCEMARGEILCVLDDDDLILPSHVRTCVERLAGGAGYYNPQHSWWLDGDTLHTDHSHGVLHNASAFTRTSWIASGGYPAGISVGEDAVMDRSLKATCGIAPPLGGDPASWTAVYRWRHSDFHISGHPDADAAYTFRGKMPATPGCWEIRPGYTGRTVKSLGHMLNQGPTKVRQC